MHPLLGTFLRLTALIAIGLVALAVAAWVLHWVIAAALVAGLVIGGLFLYNLVRRRASAPVIRM